MPDEYCKGVGVSWAGTFSSKRVVIMVSQLAISGKFMTRFSITLGRWFERDKNNVENPGGEHVGESATVCGQVASARFATNSNGQPTFLNLDKAYPKHIFTAVIFGDYRGNFDYAPESLKGAYICVTGRIDQYKGKPQVKVRNSKQIEIR